MGILTQTAHGLRDAHALQPLQRGAARLFAAPSTPRPDGGAGLAAITADGRFVACSSGEPALVAGDTNEAEDILVRGPLD